MLSVGSAERCTEPFEDGIPTGLGFDASKREAYADVRVGLCNSGLVHFSKMACKCHPPRLAVNDWEPCVPGSVEHHAQVAVFNERLRTAGLIE